MTKSIALINKALNIINILSTFFFQDGVVSKNNEYFLIKPLPTRFWKSPYNVIPHLIIKKKLQNLQLFDVQQSNYANGIKYSSRIKRSLPSSLEVRIETAVFVDHDLFRHMTSNFPINTERQLLRFVLAMVNAVNIPISLNSLQMNSL